MLPHIATTRPGQSGLPGEIEFNQVTAAWNTVGRYEEYATAQRAVDYLSDNGFDVAKLDVVGTELRLVERVTGRLTKARAAGLGALSGAWMGLLVGLLLSLFTTGATWLVIAAGLGFGAFWGAAFGFAAHAATRGQRDFTSVQGIVAGHYDLIARDGTVEQARVALGQAGLLPTRAA